ncbi:MULTISPECIES: hypothetical protein [Streptomyces]|uniref:Uncharacterized protein n=5 Tax=Streptomyces TaxID=1883 RepID=A0ABW9IB03_STRGJ|nr:MULTISPECIES: hypothetical protein [Streptomyces]KFG02944.1 hypothetical protein IQ61_43595 [Streptomyces scabiei]MBD9702115.1 hypothetical protein [Streptomyces caniscabiei]MBD9722722.1 hypothetical protein [Streptomyces caniscabiei]MBE4738791.1 hypothetical protein [Streptomyces caniscabiei]MBE4758069.1 hypothetical protein [Streptomyces caniscabiei]
MDEHGSLWQIGVIGHGPRATELADQVATEISEWNQGWGNKPPEPSFRMAVGDARDQLAASESRFLMDKTRSRLALKSPGGVGPAMPSQQWKYSVWLTSIPERTEQRYWPI